MGTLKILADGNIPYAARVFAPLGEVQTARGRELTASAVADVDLLLVRSTVKVNAGLLDGSRVRFVGTATIGTDHVDEAYLRARQVGFASAAGSSTSSVAEWVVAALLAVASRRGQRLRGQSLGIIGVGRVGSQVAKRAAALGMQVVMNDPPRAHREGPAGFASLDEALACDWVTLHVPLTRARDAGEDATYRMIDAARLARLRKTAVLINAARGAVVDGAALLAALAEGRLGGAILDCWEGEPAIDPSLCDRVVLGTPHIAGHSLDAKAEGTRMLFDAARAFLGDEAHDVPRWDVARDLPPAVVPELVIATGVLEDDEDVLQHAVKAVYDIEADWARLVAIAHLPDAERGRAFDGLREKYIVRREFHLTRVTLEPARPGARELLTGQGFR